MTVHRKRCSRSQSLTLGTLDTASLLAPHICKIRRDLYRVQTSFNETLYVALGRCADLTHGDDMVLAALAVLPETFQAGR